MTPEPSVALAIPDGLEEFRELTALARSETARRLRSPQLRAKIPSTSLLNFVLNATKLLAKVDEGQPSDEKEQAKATHVLAVISDRGIPVERQADLLTSFIEEVGPDRAQELGLTAALDILVGRNEAGKRLAIEVEVTDGDQT